MNATIATLVLLMTRFMLVEAAPCSSGCGPVLATPIAQGLESSSDNTTSCGSGPTCWKRPGVTPVKHDPLVLEATANNDGTTSIKVVVRGTDGSTSSLHPMSADHWITTIYVADADTGDIVYLKQFDEPASSTTVLPVMDFVLAAGSSVNRLKPFEYCNLHGLYQGPAVTVPFNAKATALTASNTAIPPAKPPAKHEPVLTTVDNGDGSTTVTVKVRGTDGSTTSLHPMVNGHWIDTIYVKDQLRNVVFLQEATEPTGTQSYSDGTFAAPETTFVLPAGHAVTSLTPYEHCNIHGLYEGPSVPVLVVVGTPSTPSGAQSSGSNVAMIVGIVVAVLVVLGCIAFAVYWYLSTLNSDPALKPDPDVSVDHVELDESDRTTGDNMGQKVVV